MPVKPGSTLPPSSFQKDVLTVIKKSLKKGIIPTHSEIAHILVTTPPRVTSAVQELIKKGYIKKSAHKSRNIVLLEK